jgi:hypothetical protein
MIGGGFSSQAAATRITRYTDNGGILGERKTDDEC